MIPTILFVSILFQVAAAILALRPIRQFGSKLPWGFLSTAILLMAVRRFITFAHILAGNNARPQDPVAESFALVISILMFAGIASLHRMSRQSASIFEQISTAMRETMSVVSRAGVFLYANKEAANRFSTGKLDSLTGNSIEDFIPPEQAQYLVGRYHKTLDSGSTSVEEVMLTIGGEDRWFHNSLVPIRYGPNGTPALLSVSLDITERKRHEAEIRQKDMHLREMGNLLDMAPASITVHSKDGRFLYANQASFSIHGYTHDEFMALPLSQLDGEESAAVYQERVELLKREGEASFEVTHRRKDGSTFPLKVFVRYVEWGDEEVILSVAADITERKQTEKALRESNELLNKAEELSNTGAWKLNLVNGESNISENWRHILAIQTTTPTWEEFQALIPEEDRVEVESAFSAALAGDGPYEAEHRIVRKEDGAVRHVECRGEVSFDSDHMPVMIRGVSHDITELKHAQDQLIASENRFRTIFEHSPMSMWEEDFSAVYAEMMRLRGKGTDDFGQYFKSNPQGVSRFASLIRIVDVNATSLDFFATESKEDILNDLPSYFDEESLTVFRDGLVALSRGDRAFECELPVLHPIRGNITLQLNLQVMPGFEDDWSRVLVSFFDVSDRKQLEFLLRDERDVAFALANTDSFEKALSICVDAVMRIDGIDLAGIYIFDEGSGDLVLACSQGLSDRYVPKVSRFSSNSPPSKMVVAGKPIHTDSSELPLDDSTLRREGLKATSIIPIHSRERIVGSLNVASKSAALLSDPAQHALQALASQIGGALERLKKEQQLRESEQRMRAVFNAVDGVPIQGYGNDRQVIFWNPASEKLYGYSRDEALGQLLEDLIIPEESRDAVVEGIRRWHAEGIPIPAGEVKLVHKNGESLQVYSNHVMITNTNGDMEMFCIDVDLTEIQRIEQKMASFSAVVENSDNIVVVRDLDLRVVATNQAFAKAAGHTTVDTMIGKTDAEIFGVSPDTEPVRTSMEDDRRAQGLPRGESILREEPVVAPDGQAITVLTKKYPIFDSSGELIGTGNISTDITKRKLAEDALRESQQRLSLATRSADIAIWDWDIANNKMRWDNQMFRLYGISNRPETYGVEIWENGLHPEDKKLALDACQSALCGEKDFNIEFRVQWPDGTVRHLKGDGVVIRNDANEPIRMLGINYDISEQRQLQERMRQMEKMDAIGQLAGGVAHDFNNQLACIMGYGDMLLGMLDDPELKKYVEYMLTGSRRAADLTKQLLAFARKEEKQHVPTDIHDIIHEVVAMLDRSIDKRIGVRQHLDAELRTIHGDPTQLQNAILNLGVNARDAMPEGGELFFETRNIDISPEDCAMLPYELAPGPYFEMRVRDTGSGMTEDVKKRIFEPFFTTKEVGKGTGMGLAAVYGTVKQHAGVINVYSEPGEGTCFVIQMPLSTGEVIQNERREIDSSLLHGKNILIIDDEKILRGMVVDMLSVIGCQAHPEADGAAGLAYYRDHWQDIDAVILDMIMPHMAGRDVFLGIRKINPDARVLIASGFSAGGGAQDLLEQGAAGFMQKPFQQRELMEKLVKATG